MLSFAFLLSLVTGIVFGEAPAWITSNSDPAEALRGADRRSVIGMVLRGALEQLGLGWRLVFQSPSQGPFDR